MSSVFRAGVRKGRTAPASSLEDVVEALGWYWVEQAQHTLPRDMARKLAMAASLECLEILRSYEPDPGAYRAWEKE